VKFAADSADADQLARDVRDCLELLAAAAQRLKAVDYLIEMHTAGADWDDDAEIPVGEIRDAVNGDMVIVSLPSGGAALIRRPACCLTARHQPKAQRSHEMRTLESLIQELRDLQGADMPVTFEDENGRPLEFVEAYSYPPGDRYVIVVKSADGEG
jgi:hypothetical protein